MKKYLFILISISILFTSCSQRNTVEKYTLKPVHVWEQNQVIRANKSSCEGLHGDKVFYLQQKSTELQSTDFILKINSIEGEELKSITIPQGKGPGEAYQILGVKFKNDKIYFGDLGLQRVTMLDMDGKYLDSFKYNSSKIGFVVYFEIGGNNFYFNSLSHVNLGQMNLNDGNVENKVDMDLKKLPENDTVYEGLKMVYDDKNNKLYAGHMSVPYRIDIYDENLNKIDEIEHDNLFKKAKKMRFYRRRGAGLRIAGKTIISSIALDDNYIYTPFTGSFTELKEENFQMKLNKIKPEILVTDKKTKELKARIKIQGINKIKGSFNIIGVNDKYIVTSLTDRSDKAKVVKNVYKKGSRNLILVFEKPEKL